MVLLCHMYTISPACIIVVNVGIRILTPSLSMQTDQHRWQARRLQVDEAQAKASIAQVGTLYSAASGDEPPEVGGVTG